MSLTTPSNIWELRSKLYRKAKNELPVQSRGTRPSAMKWCLGTRSPAAPSCPIEPSFVSLAVKPVGKLDAGNPYVRFDERVVLRRRHKRHAVREMKVGPSRSPCRGRLQTAISCFGLRAAVVDVMVKRRGN